MRSSPDSDEKSSSSDLQELKRSAVDPLFSAPFSRDFRSSDAFVVTVVAGAFSVALLLLLAFH